MRVVFPSWDRLNVQNLVGHLQMMAQRLPA